MVELRVEDSIEVGSCFRETPVSKFYLGTISAEAYNYCLSTLPMKRQTSPQQVIVKIAQNHRGESILRGETSLFNAAFTVESRHRNFKRNERYTHTVVFYLTRFQTRNGFTAVYAIPDANFEELAPMHNLYANAKISPRTSAWIFYDFLEINTILGRKVTGPNKKEILFSYPPISLDDYLISPKNRQAMLYNLSQYNVYLQPSDYIVNCFMRFFDWVKPFGEPGKEEYFQLLKEFATGHINDVSLARTKLERFANQHWSNKERPFTYRLNGEDIWRNL